MSLSLLRTLHLVFLGILATGLWSPSVLSQISDPKVAILVESIKRAGAVKPSAAIGLYSDWLVLPANIPRWTKSCLGKELTPVEFNADATAARQTVTCIVKDVFQEQYRASVQQESVAVRRVASWWMTGDPSQFDQGETGIYTAKVLNYYQQQRTKGLPSQVIAAVKEVKPTASSGLNSAEYDREMKLGYQFELQKNYQGALSHFQSALVHRPGDPYAEKAIANVQKNQQQSRLNPSARVVADTSISQEKSVFLIQKWLEAKAKIFAPPYDRELVSQITSGELYADLRKSDGILSWLQRQQSYYRYGVQKIDSVEKFAASGSKATIEVKVTEDRTLYRRGAVEASQTAFQTQRIRYNLEEVGKQWKITDYKTVEGSLLERTIPVTSP
ncbi:MAG: ARC6/PARC6 family protein [Thermosynechococcaceae cyanobacterium]